MPSRKTSRAAPAPSRATGDPMIEVAMPFEVPPRDPSRSSYPPPPDPSAEEPAAEPEPEPSESDASPLLVLLSLPV
ncbi:MAG: hypothetical protein JRI23_31120 [Deltaproteobacteria bacterium]|nr:hypothetical protein [Deltaproteobacteria bacterium]MBW2536654.1 hypothetical protein [Deltaproteobacteria bacterium]